MAQSSNIEWTDATWNPVTGCDKVSPGCAHCYAETLAERWRGIPGHHFENGFDLTLRPERLEQPLRWRKPRRVFVNSMSDLFHEDIPDEYIAEVFGAMAAAGRHTFQALTKRPERMRALLNREDFWATVNALCLINGAESPVRRSTLCLPNVWLGTSIENRRFVGRADLLRDTPAAVRFVSAEPLLGPLLPGEWDAESTSNIWTLPNGSNEWNDDPGLDLTGIDWLIVGGESGPKHRPIREEWVRDLRDAAIARGDFCSGCAGTGDNALAECAADGVLCGDCGGLGRFNGTAFFLKQWGGARPGGEALLDGHEWREFPQLAAGAVVPS